MRITIEIPDEEVQRVLAPLLAHEAVPVSGAVPEQMPALMRMAASDQWKDWVNRPRVARPAVAASMSSPPAPPRVKARPKPSRKPIDLTPKPRPSEPRGWTREDQLGVLKSMKEGGWPTELTALMLQDWDSGVWRTYVIRAADLAQLLKVSRSTANAMIKRGQIPSFSPEPVYRNERRETLVSVLDYQRFVGDPPVGGQEEPPSQGNRGG